MENPYEPPESEVILKVQVSLLSYVACILGAIASLFLLSTDLYILYNKENYFIHNEARYWSIRSPYILSATLMLVGAISLVYKQKYSLRIFLVSWAFAIIHTIAHYIDNKSAFDLYGFGALGKYLVAIHIVLLVLTLISWRITTITKRELETSNM